MSEPDRPEIPESVEIVSFSRFGPKMIEALCNVAFGGNGTGIAPGRLKDLEAKGLIAHEMKTGADRFGSYSWPVWHMPLHVHVQFCAWCAENAEESSDAR